VKLIEWYERPRECAHCNTALTHETNRSGNELIAWICPNSACSVKQFKNIVRFVSKDAMNMMGVGESLVESLLSSGLIKTYADLYTITLDDLLTLDGVKERSAKNALKSIEQSKSNYLDKLLVGLGISGLGRSSSGPVAEKCETFESFCTMTEPELSAIDGVGDDLVANIIEWTSDANNFPTIKLLTDLDIAQKAKPNLKQSDKLKDMVLIMTGKFDTIGRDEFKKLVVEHGGGLSSGITGKVTHVVLGDGAGPAKIKKIDELNSSGKAKIEVIDDVKFMQMIS
jgi:DNA ligase (NAD+)